MTLIEKNSTDLEDHITFWNAVRKENAIAYYSRKEKIYKLGLQPMPALAVSQYKAKEAIGIELLLRSLKNSQFGSERWTLADCSAELLHTPPKNCFKKNPYSVTVLFDNDENKAYPYTCWDYIYYQDEQNEWQKVQGLVDANGMFYKEKTGDIVYFHVFAPDAETYGDTGEWTVKFKNTTIFASIASSSRSVSGPSEQARKPTAHSPPTPKTPRKRQRETEEDTESHSPTSTSRGFRLRRGRGEQQGESATGPTPQRRRRTTAHSTVQSAPTAGEVGRDTRSVPRHGLDRLRRLQAEARDPFLVLLKGPPNCLKCWRYRCKQKNNAMFLAVSSVFRWIGDESESHARLLLAFSDNRQRQTFLDNVTLPKGTTYSLGNIDSL